MIQTEAEALAFALEAGAVQVGDIQSWADRHILAESEPHPLLIDLSTEPDPAEALTILHSLGSGSDKQRVASLTLGHLRRGLAAGVVSYLAAARLLERMVRERYVPDGADEGVMWSSADDFELVQCGEYPRDLEPVLRRDFDEFLAGNAV